jgi:hypothetical protein
MPSFKCNRKTFSDQGDFIRRGYRCATSIPTDLEIERTKNEIGSLRRSLERAGNIAINVQFIHITSGNNGQITKINV